MSLAEPARPASGGWPDLGITDLVKTGLAQFRRYAPKPPNDDQGHELPRLEDMSPAELDSVIKGTHFGTEIFPFMDWGGQK